MPKVTLEVREPWRPHLAGLQVRRQALDRQAKELKAQLHDLNVDLQIVTAEINNLGLLIAREGECPDGIPCSIAGDGTTITWDAPEPKPEVPKT